MWLSAAAATAFVAVCAYYMNFDNQLRGEEEEGRSVLSACPSLLQLYSQGLLLEACRPLFGVTSSGSQMGW